MLQSFLYRAARIVIDTGMHAKGWSREQAIRYFIETVGLDEISATSEIERYVVWPGQACSYKIGHNEFVRLREQAQARLGDRFDLKAFHDAVLLNGDMPLEVLAGLVADWTEGGWAEVKAMTGTRCLVVLTFVVTAVACRPGAETSEVAQSSKAEASEVVKASNAQHAAAVVPADTESRSQALAAIASNWRDCLDGKAYPAPTDLQDCNSQAIEGANALVALSEGNALLDRLFPDLFEPLLFARTGGEDAWAHRVGIVYGYAEFAQARAAILTGAAADTPTNERPARTLASLLLPLGDRDDMRALERRWLAVRTADCVAYPVPRCAERLDEAFRSMVEGLLTVG